MHFIYGGKHTTGHEITAFIADVTCGTCKRTKAFRTEEDRIADSAATAMVQLSLVDAGFVTGRIYNNFAIGRTYTITSADRFGIVVVVNTPTDLDRNHSFGDLEGFLRWITQKDMNVNAVVDGVLNGGLTWTESVDMVWSNAAEVADVSRIEEALNERIAYKFSLADTVRDYAIAAGRTPVAEEIATPSRPGSKHKSTSANRRYRKGA